MRPAILTILLSATLFGQTVNLPSSKTLEPVPGSPQKLNSFPSNIVISPDGHYAAILNQGYGSALAEGRQSIAIYDIDKMQLRDFPDARLGYKAQQTYYIGLAFSTNGDEIYASMASLKDPEGKKPGSTGNGIAVYSFHDGQLAPKRFLKIPLQTLASGKRFVYGTTKIPAGTAIPYPAGLAVVPPDAQHPHDRLLIANNLSDNAVLLDAETGETLHTFDLSTKDFVPAVFPHSVVVAPDGKRAWVSLWNSPAVAELDLGGAIVSRTISLGPDNYEFRSQSSAHSTSIAVSPDQESLFVSLSNLGKISALNLQDGNFDDISLDYVKEPNPGRGAYPSSLALSADKKWLLATCSGLNGVALVELDKLSKAHQRNLQIEENAKHSKSHEEPVFVGVVPSAFIPTQWYPTAVAIRGDDVLIANAKGAGTGPNSGTPAKGDTRKKFPYVASLLNGSLQHTRLSTLREHAKGLNEQVLRSNHLQEKLPHIQWSPAVAAKLPAGLRTRGPIRHVIYVIKENRTYDQLFGDLGAGNGDKSLTMYGWDITPNQHKLALQFGVLDNFYDSGEISGNGHDWSMAAITSDYTERNWPIDYRASQREYDYEGMVGGQYPMQQGIPDINEPGTGFLWGLVARNQRTYRHYGEFINTEWCRPEEEESLPATGSEEGKCDGPMEVKKGEPLPSYVGDPKGGPSPYPWSIPMMARNIPTKPELVGHFDPRYPDFKTDYPDQLRVDEFLNEFDGFVRARKEGKAAGEMPELVVLRLPNDHTYGTTALKPAPIASLADNDLAVGRVVEAISHSAYWDDTAILILEDDAQDGPDHVDAHRSLALVISKYSPSSAQKPYIEHGFYTTVNMIRTLEELLGLPCMNINDCYAAPMWHLFGGAGKQPAFTADRSNLENGTLYKMNPPKAKNAKASSKLDFSHADAADATVLNRILWEDRKGSRPMPKPKHKVIREDDDD